MWADAVDLRDFYATGLGRMTRHLLRRRIRMLYPDAHGWRILGLGFASPFLGVLRIEAELTIAAMSAAQGVLAWPADAPNLVTLVDELDLPLADNSIDLAILVHAIECADELRPMLREVWRVLSDGGRLLVIAPNRRGIWARLDRTPFGHGQPYTQYQLSRLLRDNMFTPLRTAHALFVPPARSRMLMASATAWEEIGARWFQTFAGVLMIEAAKQIYGATPVAPVRRRGRAAYVSIGGQASGP